MTADDRAERIDRLIAAGFEIEGFTDEQVEVLLGLGPDELEILLDIKTRLEEAGPEVRAHSEIAGGALF
jgi:hypothetical protein